MPLSMKIHNVFHVNLLLPYKEMKAYGQAYTRPTPDLIKGEEEYEVESICDARRYERGQKLQYLVHQMTSGLITKTYMCQNCLKNITNLPRLDELMYKRPLPPSIFHMTFVFTIHTSINMSRSATSTITLSSTPVSPWYIPLSLTIELEDTFIAWTPQLAIRSAGPIRSPTNDQQLLTEIWGLVASRIATAQNIFSTTLQHAHQSFGPELKAKVYGLVHFHEPLPEFPASKTREEIIIVCEPPPTATEVLPPYLNGTSPPSFSAPNTPSPNSIPIPPQFTEERLVDSSDPLGTETAISSPTPSVVEIPAPEPVDENHPGEGWQANICREGIAYPMQILDEDGAITIAPYLCLDLNGGNSHIEGTLGQGCPVTSCPLHTTPDHYPCIMVTDRQLQYSKVGEAQTALANRALRDEQDISFISKTSNLLI